MGLDLRIPIGLLFATLGALLMIFGVTGDPEMYRQSLGVNVNAWWGLVMFVFGVAMLALARRAASRKAPE